MEGREEFWRGPFVFSRNVFIRPRSCHEPKGYRSMAEEQKELLFTRSWQRKMLLALVIFPGVPCEVGDRSERVERVEEAWRDEWPKE